jgi:hypothetical protein
MRYAGNVARVAEKGNLYIVLVGKAEGKRPLGKYRHSRRSEENIVMCRGKL